VGPASVTHHAARRWILQRDFRTLHTSAGIGSVVWLPLGSEGLMSLPDSEGRRIVLQKRLLVQKPTWQAMSDRDSVRECSELQLARLAQLEPCEIVMSGNEPRSLSRAPTLRCPNS
jgi:hypothetical protein